MSYSICDKVYNAKRAKGKILWLFSFAIVSASLAVGRKVTFMAGLGNQRCRGRGKLDRAEGRS